MRFINARILLNLLLKFDWGYIWGYIWGYSEKTKCEESYMVWGYKSESY